jgi:hypothetical protein
LGIDTGAGAEIVETYRLSNAEQYLAMNREAKAEELGLSVLGLFAPHPIFRKIAYLIKGEPILLAPPFQNYFAE